MVFCATQFHFVTGQPRGQGKWPRSAISPRPHGFLSLSLLYYQLEKISLFLIAVVFVNIALLSTRVLLIFLII